MILSLKHVYWIFFSKFALVNRFFHWRWQGRHWSLQDVDKLSRWLLTGMQKRYKLQWIYPKHQSLLSQQMQQIYWCPMSYMFFWKETKPHEHSIVSFSYKFINASYNVIVGWHCGDYTTESKRKRVISDGTENNVTLCPCVCTNASRSLSESIEMRRNKLKVNKTALTSSIRRRTSASDHRMSSRVIGAVGIIIIVIFGMLIICSDVFSVFYSKSQTV